MISAHRRRILSALAIVVPLLMARPARAQDCTDQTGGPFEMKGRISRNFYRVPYLDEGFPASVGANDYWGHGGSFDMNGGGPSPLIVAPADGVVCYIREDLNDCGCNDAFGGCGNVIMVAHDFGEFSAHLHIAQWSASEFDIQVGDAVHAGDVIAREGDVGRTCGNTSAPRIGTCVTTLPAGTTNCGRHNHWNIRREVDAGGPNRYMELLQPMTCEVAGNLYAANSNYLPSACDSNTSCTPTAVSLSATTLDGFGVSRVVQSADRISATTVIIRNRASAVFHAPNSVRLQPGFEAGAGDAYFRAEIGACNQTAPGP